MANKCELLFCTVSMYIKVLHFKGDDINCISDVSTYINEYMMQDSSRLHSYLHSALLLYYLRILHMYVYVINLLVMLLLQYGRTALDLAYDRGYHKVAEFLLSKGGKVKNCNKVSMYIQTSNIVYCRAVKLNKVYIHVQIKSFYHCTTVRTFKYQGWIQDV